MAAKPGDGLWHPPTPEALLSTIRQMQNERRQITLPTMKNKVAMKNSKVAIKKRKPPKTMMKKKQKHDLEPVVSDEAVAALNKCESMLLARVASLPRPPSS